MTKKKTKTASPVKVDPLVVNGKKIEIVYLPIDKLIPADYNPRKISDHDLEHLKKSLMHFGSIDPAIINTHEGREGIIVGGHQRIRAATALGWTEFPCVQVSLTLEKEKELNIRLNRNSGQWDFNVLANEFSAKELFSFGFDEGDKLDQWFGELIDKKDKDEGDFTSGPDENDTSMVVLAGKEGWYFESKAPFGIPELLVDMLAPIPEPISCWAGADASEPCEHYFWSYNTDSTRGADWKNFVVGFYTDDKRFEKTWDDPPYVARKILNRQPIACVTPNFSLWGDMPKAVKIWSSYRSRWVGRYWQECGIKVIPDIQTSDISSLEYCLAGIPKNAPALSMQIQTAKKTLAEIEIRKQITKEVLNTLKPQSILVYGLSDHYEQLFKPVCPKQLHVVFVESRIGLRGKVMKKEKQAGESLSV